MDQDYYQREYRRMVAAKSLQQRIKDRALGKDRLSVKYVTVSELRALLGAGDDVFGIQVC